VSIHPLAIVLAIATGAVLAGIIGALLSVPLLAFLNSAIRVLVAPEESDPAGDGGFRADLPAAADPAH
jgi:predicted PurR-regulated permease PerM